MLPFELSPREERAHVRRGSLQRIARFLLARQRPVNGNLEDLGEFAVDRCGRTRDGMLDDATRIRRDDAKRVLQFL